MVRNQLLKAEEEVYFMSPIGVRGRMKNPAMTENYFGNAITIGIVTMIVKELLEGGIGKGALEMNKMVGLQTEEKLKSYSRNWIKNPTLTVGGVIGNTFLPSSSPRFDVYGNDFGWGKPVAVRSGAANKKHRKITLFPGVEDGSVDVEVCLSHEILEAMGKDPEFMDAVDE
ncbi:hypothetical protein PIB30_057846 [Stylosanthes scabra]|uniref:Uncharacterized protein n=1 Tax=Stylosanthes scabra TaxID=79078 RepID=A0ABU6VJK7_9FABA|nr:hypothetical protein [Stylosanthes scabra]